jgi:hypothetical protein
VQTQAPPKAKLASLANAAHADQKHCSLMKLLVSVTANTGGIDRFPFFDPPNINTSYFWNRIKRFSFMEARR